MSFKFKKEENKLNHFVTQVDLMNEANIPYRELLKKQKIEAITFAYGKEHLNETVIQLIDDSLVTGWYYEEWGVTLEEFMKNLNIKTDEELLETYINWVENVNKDLEIMLEINTSKLINKELETAS